MSPSKRTNPPPLHASNTPEALAHLPPISPYGPPSFPLPPGLPQLNGHPAPILPAESHPFIQDPRLLADLPPSRISGVPPMTAHPPVCPRPRPNKERIGGEMEVRWEREQERVVDLNEMRPLLSAGFGATGRSACRRPPQRRAPSPGGSVGVGVGSPWSSLMIELDETDFDPTTLLLDTPASSLEEPSFFSRLLSLLGTVFAPFLFLFRRAFRSERSEAQRSEVSSSLPSFPRSPSPPSRRAELLEAGFNSDDDFVEEYGSPWRDSDYDG